jgi:hypothetical protein
MTHFLEIEANRTDLNLHSLKLRYRSSERLHHFEWLELKRKLMKQAIASK